MRVYQPGTDCEVEFTILANGKKCPEFVKPEDAEEDLLAKVCFIPIEDGATITIQGNFSGSALVGRIDVLVDGSFVANRIIDDTSTKDPTVRYWNKRKVEVKTFLHVPDLDDKKNHLSRPKIVEGNLIATRLPPAIAKMPLYGGPEASSLGVGSITLVISHTQQSEDTHGDDKVPYYPFVTLPSWRERIDEVMDSGIRPEHELTMEVFPGSNPIKDKKATQFWRDQKAKRFGSNAWAYLVFYYRTQDAIDEAGAQPLTESKALPPDDGTFIRAGERKALAHKVNESPLLSPLGSEPVSPTNPAKGTRRSLRLGQALPPVEGRTTRQTSLQRYSLSDDNNDGDETLVPTHQPTQHKSKGKATNTNPPAAQPSMPPPPTSMHAPTIPAPQMKTSRVSFSDPLEMLDKLGNPATKPSDEHRVDDLAAPFLSNMSPRAVRSKPIPKPLPTEAPPPRYSLGSANLISQKPPTKRAIEQANAGGSPKQPERTSLVSQAPPTKNPMAEAVADDSSSPTSSTPAKRPRLEEMSQKKARLQAELQAKRDRRISEQKRLEEGKRQHEAQQRLWAEREAKRSEEEQKRKAAEEEQEKREEEALAAEMEALERENEAEDEEMRRLEEERTMFEGKMDELE